MIMTDAEDTGSKLRLQDAIEAAQRSDAVIHVMLITDRMATFGIGRAWRARWPKKPADA